MRYVLILGLCLNLGCGDSSSKEKSDPVTSSEIQYSGQAWDSEGNWSNCRAISPDLDQSGALSEYDTFAWNPLKLKAIKKANLNCLNISEIRLTGKDLGANLDNVSLGNAADYLL